MRIGRAPLRFGLLAATAVPALILALVLLVPLSIGVWLPDVWSGPKTLAQTQMSSGQRFRVVQYLGADFYTVELVYTLPNGKERRGLIDGDAPKWWSADLTVDESRKGVTINGIPYPWPVEDMVDLRLPQMPDETIVSGIP